MAITKLDLKEKAMQRNMAKKTRLTNKLIKETLIEAVG